VGGQWRRDVRVLYWYWPSPPKTFQHAGYDAAQYSIVMNVAKWTNVLHVIEPVNQKKKKTTNAEHGLPYFELG
jgi:hypothetical protein